MFYFPDMGLFSSKPKPEPKPKPETPLLDEPWREINWSDRQGALQAVNNFRPQTEDQQIRILLHGPVGAGKSSFINSVQSVLLGRMYKLALVDNVSHGCFTKKYITYKIQKERPKTFYPFVFNDIMGLDSTEGFQVDDIKLALMGHVKDGYKFNPKSKLSKEDRFYNKSPSVNDQVQVLVCVVPADTLEPLKDKTVQKIRDIRLEASHLGIPQVAILTKVDKACPEVGKDLKNIYRSKRLKEKMEEFSKDTGIPMNCIFPIKNYHEEIELSDDADVLILSTLRHLLSFGEDFLKWKAARH
ncbi:interferon-induced protein 44-like [Toxotes jaculatrix]|uniref:interferon-induced protein 44-like n=1 Tax=Toxotes jaculatrix TaxID=941984 RepID=UPI001B3AF817|nr:interferon-induced protein 44-like [Toxotes jaculatrix]